MKHWKVEEPALLLDDGGTLLAPDASAVFDALGYGGMISQDAPNPAIELPNIRFSKYGAALALHVSSGPDGSFLLEPIVTRRGRRLDGSRLTIPIPEHFISGTNWVYFSEGRDEANSAFASLGIESFGKITLAQYCQLAQLAHCHACAQINDDLLGNIRAHQISIDDAVPATLNAKLYPYQERGYKWLSYMAKQTDGCVLGDEMGLGKTLQVITLLLSRHEAGYGTSLVIAPVSLLENWRRELEKFAPTLNVLLHHGTKRTGRCASLRTYDVVVMSYGSAVSDLGMLKMGAWDVVVLDEAQGIKNPDSQRSITVKSVPRTFGVAVSGTPFENHILDVWSVMDYAEPALLGDRSSFEREYPDDMAGAAKLEGVISPFLLRRTVSEVARDLPEKVEVPTPLMLLDSEAEDYEVVRKAISGSVSAGTATLATLTKLRMFCTHPFLMEPDDAPWRDPFSCSAKYQHLCSLLEEIVERREKVIIFTSYRKMFAIFKRDLSERFGVTVLQIDGSTQPAERQKVVDRFSSVKGSAVLVLNPTAAGTGLNITTARNVIHFNLEWNPAKEDQATARAYRRGQTQNVFVHRLFYSDTVEEAILERMDLKREMAGSAIVGTRGDSADREAIVRALNLSPLRRS